MNYRTIVADPPWRYPQKWASITHGGRGPRIETALPYTTMETQQIAGLPVGDLAARDCRVFLWSTSRYLRDAYAVLDGWGFTFSQMLIWHKTGNPSPFSGSGVAPIHHEYLLVAKRGEPELLERLPSSVISAPAAVSGHSTKPECFIDCIERVSPGPRLEMFARRARLGWDYYGNESLGTAALGGSG